MITIPWIVFCIIGGALSALGSWLFHLIFKNHKDNAARIAVLEENALQQERKVKEV